MAYPERPYGLFFDLYGCAVWTPDACIIPRLPSWSDTVPIGKKVSQSDDNRAAVSECDFMCGSELLEEDTVPRQFPAVPVER